MKKQKHINLRLDPQMKKRIEKLAKEKDMNFSQTVRALLKFALHHIGG